MTAAAPARTQVLATATGSPRRAAPATASGDGASPVRTGREPWIDLARGVCVLLVVLYHVVLWHLPQLAAPRLRPATWDHLNDVVGGIRMPLLLMLSGMLAQGKVSRGRAAVRGAVANLWLYAVWLVVFALVYALAPLPTPQSVALGTDLARQLVLPGTPLWYVFALACYLLLMWAVRPLPTWLVLVALAVPTLLLHPGDRMWMKVPVLTVYFAIGVRLAAPLREAVRRRAWALVLLGVALYVTGGVMTRVAGTDWTALQASFLVGNLGKGAAALGLAWYAAHLGPLAGAGAWLGRHTLTVYVLHPLLLGAVMAVVARTGALDGLLGRTGGLALLWPAVLTVAVTALALALEPVLRRLSGGALFGLPEPVARRLAVWEARG